MAKEYKYLLMGINIKGNSRMAEKKETREFINGKTITNTSNMMGHLRMIICVGRAL